MKTILMLFTILIATVLSAATPKYIFLFIGDGMAAAQRGMSEEYSKIISRGPLYMNDMPVKSPTITKSANSLVTDSAAAATAIACGVKTKNRMLGLDPEGNRLESCAEFAKKNGKKVGIITTVTLTHATPAGFYAHRTTRGDGYGIGADLVNSGFDFFAGGGFDGRHKKKNHPEYKKYGHLYNYAETKGYKVIKTKSDFFAHKKSDGKVLTRFTNNALPYTIDTNLDDNKYPTLSELVKKGIEILDDDSGFFMMVEGGRIDWAGHANDAGTNIREILGLDDAVKVAIDFYKKHPKETLIIVTGDHETGGLTMGVANTGKNLNIKLMMNQSMSVDKFKNQFENLFKSKKGKITIEDTEDIVCRAFGLKFKGDANKDPLVITKDEMKEIKKAFDKDMDSFNSKVKESSQYDGIKSYVYGTKLRHILNRKAGLYWSTGSHTGQPVLTTAVGCGSEKFKGTLDNTDISKNIKSLLKK